MPYIFIIIVASIYDCISVRHVSLAVLAQAMISSGGNPSVARLAMRNTISSSVATCKKVLEWMYGHEMTLPKQFKKRMDVHEDSLPLRVKRFPSVAQRAENRLRNQFQYLKSKTNHPPEVRALLDQISQQRTRPDARLARRKLLSSSTTNCKKVLDWMDAHDGNLPVLLRHATC